MAQKKSFPSPLCRVVFGHGAHAKHVKCALCNKNKTEVSGAWMCLNPECREDKG